MAEDHLPGCRCAGYCYLAAKKNRRNKLGGMGQWFSLGWLHFEQCPGDLDIARSLAHRGIVPCCRERAQEDLGLQRERSAAAAAVVSSAKFISGGWFWPGFWGRRLGFPVHATRSRSWSKMLQRDVEVGGVFLSRFDSVVNGPSPSAPPPPLSPVCWWRGHWGVFVPSPSAGGGAGKQSSARGLTPPRIATTCQPRVETMPATFHCINRS